MEFKFPIRNITLKKDLSDKITTLGAIPNIQRIIVGINIAMKEPACSLDAIFDTGAPFCLLPASLMADLGDLKTITHTVIVICPRSSISIIPTRSPKATIRNPLKKLHVDPLTCLTDRENIITRSEGLSGQTQQRIRPYRSLGLVSGTLAIGWPFGQPQQV
jgi:hypothetical protein